MLSIVIVSFNTCKLLDDCLASIEKHCYDYEVIVVDNDSRDESVQMVRSKYPDVNLICPNANLGFAGANNRAIEESQGEYIILLNSDTILEDDSLNRCVEYMNQNPKTGAVSPKLLGVDGVYQRAFHAFPSVTKRIRQAFARNREIKVADPVDEGWLAGTALMLRRTALEDIGGKLDSNYWMYWEDADTSAHLIRKGWKVEVCADACIRHYGGASGGGPDAQRRSDLYAHYAWGEQKWFFKNRPIWESGTVWFLDFVDLFRRTLRGTLRSGRRGELNHAKVLAKVLFWRIFAMKPPVPAQNKS